jgi:hypothetical protein
MVFRQTPTTANQACRESASPFLERTATEILDELGLSEREPVDGRGENFFSRNTGRHPPDAALADS